MPVATLVEDVPYVRPVPRPKRAETLSPLRSPCGSLKPRRRMPTLPGQIRQKRRLIALIVVASLGVLTSLCTCGYISIVCAGADG